MTEMENIENINEYLLTFVKDKAEPEKKKRGRPRKQTDNTSSEEGPKEKNKVGRPIAEWRHNEDGTIDNRARDPKYMIKYWRDHYRKPFTCEICGTTLQSCSSAVHKHQRGMRCQLAKLKQQLA